MSRYTHNDPILASILTSRKKDEELTANDQDTKEKIDTVTANDAEKTKTSHWNNIKTIIEHTKDATADATGKTSMTEQESAFLKLRNQYLKENPSDKDSDDEEEGAKNSFIKVVNDAVARARLRQDLTTRLLKLTTKEAKFLKDIVKDENVTKQQLEHANYVLNTDPLYRLPGETSSNIGSSMGSGLTEEIEIPPNAKLRDFIQGHRVQIDGRDIEILLNWDEFGNELSKSEANLRMSSINLGVDMESNNEEIPSFPSTFSYQTWEATSDEEMRPILGLPEEFNEASQVLSPPMLSSLRKALPFCVAEDYFWLKYAMNTDGASLQSLFYSIRQSPKTLFAIETVNGEVFGAFVSSPWRNYASFYGSCEAFVWRMNKSRYTPTSSIEEQIELESDIDVFKWSQENRNIQMSNENQLVIGGGFPEDDNDEDSDKWGLGIVLGKDLFEGTSSQCVTFKSPSLTQVSPKGEVFEVANMEVWAFTPCMNEKDAEQLEMGRMFVLSHFDQA